MQRGREVEGSLPCTSHATSMVCMLCSKWRISLTCYIGKVCPNQPLHPLQRSVSIHVSLFPPPNSLSSHMHPHPSLGMSLPNGWMKEWWLGHGWCSCECMLCMLCSHECIFASNHLAHALFHQLAQGQTTNLQDFNASSRYVASAHCPPLPQGAHPTSFLTRCTSPLPIPQACLHLHPHSNPMHMALKIRSY